MIETRFGFKWRRVEQIGDAFMICRPGSGGILGIVIGPAAMAARFRDGRARVVPDPEPPTPPAIAVSDPSVAGMLDAMDISRVFTAA
jgi:hypothetical protein